MKALSSWLKWRSGARATSSTSCDLISESLRGAAIDGDEVVLLFLRHFHRLPVDRVDDRPQRALVAPITRTAAQQAIDREPLAGEQADRRRAPERRGGVEASHIEALLEDHAGAEKADARDDLGRDARIARATRRDPL